MLTVQDFVNRWGQSALREQQAAQSHFNELCQLVYHKTPTQLDPQGTFFTFEENVAKATGGSGRADVWYKGRFAWEYKGKHKDLDAAYTQLSNYRGALGNPPLLVVCDFLEYRIHPQWPNMSGRPFIFKNEDLLREDALRYIRWLLEKPEEFKNLRQAELEQRNALTLELAGKFAELARLMRGHKGADGAPLWTPMQVARFLTKLVFLLFAEDVDLLPRIGEDPMFRFFTNQFKKAPGAFVSEMRALFEALDGRTELYRLWHVPYFDGSLFADSAPGAGDGMEVLDMTLIPGAIDLLAKVSEENWREVNPAIFGTLFEGALDESKRAQLGAHYTGEPDIRLMIEPVLMQPINRQWDAIRAEAEPLKQIFDDPASPPRAVQEAREKLIALHNQMMDALANTRVLDPACGSGNFLYVSLRAMKEMEARIREFFASMQLPFRDVVTPRQLYGIEKDEFAARLAYVVVWIGYLQCRFDEEGILHPVYPHKIGHPRALPNPILGDDRAGAFLNDDAIMRYRPPNDLSSFPPLPEGEGTGVRAEPYEPEWPEVDVIVGNPPFLGGKRMRGELGNYVDDLFRLYRERVPPEADLVTYWFEKARAQIEQGKAKRAGLLATNSIRGGANREVLKRIKETGDIFMAWSDRAWVLQGAAVRISIVGFEGDVGARHALPAQKILDGELVAEINADLTGSSDVTQANTLAENANLAFMGVTPAGPFDISKSVANELINSVNSSGRSNTDVVRHYFNAVDITDRPRDIWIIDFGTDLPVDTARQYEKPFAYIEEVVLPARIKSKQPEREKQNYWIFTRSRPEMRNAIQHLDRYIATPMVSKHRIFVWLSPEIVPANLLNVFPRDDDYFFGVLHSYVHETWSLRLGTWLGKGNDPRYTPTTTFETFPFPWPPGQEEINAPAYQAISAAAKTLHEERAAWLNPPELIALGAERGGSTLRERTLTNLYNALSDLRTGTSAKNGKNAAAVAFAPRLRELHDALDVATLAAYSWDDLSPLFAPTSPPNPPSVHGEGELSAAQRGEVHIRTPEGDEELLRRLLALNAERANT